MRNLSDTIARLAAFRAQPFGPTLDGAEDRLSDLGAFGSNPGGLRARFHAPRTDGGAMPLVVVLHGCKQSAAGYDAGTGWSQLADEAGFAVLYPEQMPGNNLNGCFNWFQAGDARRDEGEVLSIRQMIDAMAARHPIDPSRIFITGLSAGGAMASAMLASYPELFAGGAIIAGLPFGVATTVPEAFDAMRAQGLPDGPALRRLLPATAPAGGWPTLSVWHGTADQTVAVANADAIIEQWRGVNGVASQPDEESRSGRVTRRIWRDRTGRPVLEQVLIAGMGHGTPIDDKGPDALGRAAPFILDVGVSSTRQIAAAWGLAAEGTRQTHRGEARTPRPEDFVRTTDMPERPEAPAAGATGAPGSKKAGEAKTAVGGIRKVIEDALRQAGLM